MVDTPERRFITFVGVLIDPKKMMRCSRRWTAIAHVRDMPDIVPTVAKVHWGHWEFERGGAQKQPNGMARKWYPRCREWNVAVVLCAEKVSTELKEPGDIYCPGSGAKLLDKSN